MTAERRFADPEHLAALARAVFGNRRRLVATERLAGGTKKGVYRLAFDDDSTAIVYSWDPDENYWPSSPSGDGDGADQGDGKGDGKADGKGDDEDWADPFSHASGFELFEAARTHLDAVGVRSPRVYLADRSRAHFPADVAVVEDLRGPNLETLLVDDPAAASAVVGRLGDALGRMHAHLGPTYGKVAMVKGGGRPVGSSCEQVVLDNALADLAGAASRDRRVARAHDEFADVLRLLAGAIRPRTEYGLIHGELGPDHVMVGSDGAPVLIDIEGLMFFDVEWEHVFLRIRFGAHYAALRRDDLDRQRLALYRLAMHLSLVANPLLILDTDFPNREGMRRIAEANLAQSFGFLN
ncbi:phosphotransferase [Actinopolymorpha sp. NPDC004070]|uniref:phosphotransferase family protein n=1 Tax=Actinopolymorpha sp. NPDC004070 TaxID=3154548 RepID=UPI0033AB1665